MAGEQKKADFGWFGDLVMVLFVFGWIGLAIYAQYAREPDPPPADPTKVMVVEGTFPFSKGWRLLLTMNYYSSQSDCLPPRLRWSLFAPSRHLHPKQFYVRPVPGQSDQYRIELPTEIAKSAGCTVQAESWYAQVFDNRHQAVKIRGTTVDGVVPPVRESVLTCAPRSATDPSYVCADRQGPSASASPTSAGWERPHLIRRDFMYRAEPISVAQ